MARATHCTVDPTEFSQTPSDAAHEEAVLLADSTSLPTLGIVDVPITIQGYKATMHCVVIDLSDDYDIILSDSWLYGHAGVINYRRGHIRVVSHGREVTLRTDSAVTSAQQPTLGPSPHIGDSPPLAHLGHLCSIGYAHRAYQWSAHLCLVLVRWVGDLLEGNAPGIPDSYAGQLAPVSDITVGQVAPTSESCTGPSSLSGPVTLD